MIVKMRKKTYKVSWSHVRRDDIPVPTTTHCFISDEKGLIAHAETECTGNCYNKPLLRKNALKAAIIKAIPRQDLKLRILFWDKFATMTKKRRWKKQKNKSV